MGDLDITVCGRYSGCLYACTVGVHMFTCIVGNLRRYVAVCLHGFICVRIVTLLRYARGRVVHMRWRVCMAVLRTTSNPSAVDT